MESPVGRVLVRAFIGLSGELPSVLQCAIVFWMGDLPPTFEASEAFGDQRDGDDLAADQERADARGRQGDVATPSGGQKRRSTRGSAPTSERR